MFQGHIAIELYVVTLISERYFQTFNCFMYQLSCENPEGVSPFGWTVEGTASHPCKLIWFTGEKTVQKEQTEAELRKQSERVTVIILSVWTEYKIFKNMQKKSTVHAVLASSILINMSICVVSSTVLRSHTTQRKYFKLTGVCVLDYSEVGGLYTPGIYTTFKIALLTWRKWKGQPVTGRSWCPGSLLWAWHTGFL